MSVTVSEVLQSQSPGLDLQRQEAEQQAQRRRQQRTHGGAVETNCPGEGGSQKTKILKFRRKKNPVKTLS